jgi:hypothetical protein
MVKRRKRPTSTAHTYVATEMALHVLAYNMTRVMAILGVPGLVKALTA